VLGIITNPAEQSDSILKSLKHKNRQMDAILVDEYQLALGLQTGRYIYFFVVWRLVDSPESSRLSIVDEAVEDGVGVGDPIYGAMTARALTREKGFLSRVDNGARAIE
jgi:hypothetical protein